MIEYSEISKISGKKALGTFIDKHFEGDNDLFVSELNKSVSRLLHVDLKKAGRLVKKAQRLFVYLPDRYNTRLLAMEARFEHWSGNPKSALNKYRDAVEEMLSLRQYELAARTRQGLMDVEMYLGKYMDALETGRKALRYFRRKDKHNLAARVMTNIGNIYHRLDKNRMALRYYDRARNIFEKEGGIPLAIVDYNRANIFANMGELKKAEELYRQTSLMYKTAGIGINAAKADYSLAYLYFLSDKYTLALSAFEKVHQDFINLGDEKSAAAALLDMAEMNIYLHQYSSSITLAEKVIPLYRRFRQPYEEGKAHFFAAQSLRELGDYKYARKYLNNAERLFKAEKNRLWQGMVYYLKSLMSLDKNRIKNARSSASEAKKHFSGSGDERRIVDAELILLEAKLRAGNGSLQQAQKIKGKKYLGYQKYNLNKMIGEYYLRQEDYRNASIYFRSCTDLIENTLMNLYPDEIRFFYTLGKQEVYLELMECLLKMGRVEESFAENSRALALLNQQIPSGKIKKTDVPEKYIRRQEYLRSLLKEVERLPKSGERQAESTMALKKAEEELWRTEMKIRAIKYPVSDNIISSAPKADYSRHLKSDEILLNFVAFDYEAGVYRLQKDRIEYFPLEISISELSDLIGEFHFLMERSVYSTSDSTSSIPIIEDYQKRFYKILLKPVLYNTNIGRLIFMVDGVFAQIPYWGLLDEEGRPLFEKYGIRIISNPADLNNQRKSFKFGKNKKTAIFAPENSSLPLINIEGKKIREHFKNAELFEEGRASCRNLLDALGSTEGFVHIAAHASRSSENPLFSRIIMDDGPFFPFDLFGARVNSTLITLSGCQTAAPGVFYGNSFSLAKAFYQAGARYVLASLWPVSDKISVVFMDEFYRALAKEADIFAAYRQALEKIRKLNLNPAFWSPFVLLGI
jgi:CHAT domain-containing protein